MTKEYDISFHCNYRNGDATRHGQVMKLKDIPKWIEAYKFTHPACTSISIKIWFKEENQ